MLTASSPVLAMSEPDICTNGKAHTPGKWEATTAVSGINDEGYESWRINCEKKCTVCGKVLDTKEESGKKKHNKTEQTKTGKKSATKKIIRVKKVKVAKKKITMKAGTTKKISASVLPKNTTNKKMIYKSSNNKIATVTKAGKVKAKKKGKCTITVTSKDGKKKAKVKVTVK